MQGKGALRSSTLRLFIALGIWHCSGCCLLSLAQCTNTASAKNDPLTNAAKISIHVQVTDKSGHPVSGLEATDFKVFDNNQQQQILDFCATNASHPAAVPPQIKIIIDAMNSGPLSVAQERDGVSAFLNQNGGKLEYSTSIWALQNEGLQQIAPPSKEGTALAAALGGAKIPERVINQSGGRWGDLERANQAIEVVKKLIAPDSRTPDRKFVLFLSQGWPLLLNFEPDKRNWVFDEIVDISNGLRESGISFYALSPSEFSSNYSAYDNFLKAARKISDARNADLCLQVLSDHSGGLVISEGNDIKAEINAAARDAGDYYTVSFERASSHGRTEFHEIHVTTDKPRLQIRTTAGYYVKGP